MNSKEIDEIDKMILRKLLKDARTSSTDIAKELGLSLPSITRRIEKMEKQGIIAGTALFIISPETKREFVLLITVKLTSKEHEEKVMKELKKMKGVFRCSAVISNYDILVLAFVRDIEGIQKLQMQIKQIYGIERIGITANLDRELFFFENMLK